MPRGRPPRQSAATPSSARNDSAGTSSSTGRRTRSAAPNLDEMSPSVLSDGSKKSIVQRPRGRPSRASLLATVNAAASDSVTQPSPTIPKRGPGRSRKSNPPVSESASSVPTPDADTEESRYSTPATSNFPTPAAADVPTTLAKGKGKQSIEVLLPAKTNRAARAVSKYALNSTRNRTTLVLNDSMDEDDEFSDQSPDGLVARRLQKEEDSNMSRNFGGHTRALSKRPRVSTDAGQPSKKLKVEPGVKKETDLDAEIAAGAAYTSEDDAPARGPPFSPFYTTSDDDSAYDPDDPYLTWKRTGEAPAWSQNRIQPSVKSKATSSKSRQPSAVVNDDEDSELSSVSDFGSMPADDSDNSSVAPLARIAAQRRGRGRRNSVDDSGLTGRGRKERDRLIRHHPELLTMWDKLKEMPVLKAGKAPQPTTISRQLKGFQLEGLAWMKAMEKTTWKGGLLGDEMGLGKTIQAVSLIMSDYPAKQPSLVLVPPVALMQWQSEIASYTDGTLKTFVFHGTNQKAKTITVKELKTFDVIMMSYNSLESMYRKQEKGFKRKDGMHLEKSVIHAIDFHRIILDEAHSIKTRSTMTAKACFALKTAYRWCLSGTPLQNRIGEFFSLIRFLNVQPFASYLCKQCPCSTLEWSMDADKRCSHCNHAGMQHVSVFNQELLNPIQRFGNLGPGREAFQKLRLLTDRVMLRRLKKDHTNAMELPVKEIYVDRQFFGEEENDFANSIMTSGQRKFDTYVSQGVLLNNYANIFGLIMQMRQVADHPDLILKKNADGGQNVLICSICDETAEDTVRSQCKHDFCRACVASYVRSTDEPDCPRCHISLKIDLEQPEIEQEENMVKKNSIINRIKMENWTSSSKIELLVHQLHRLRSDNASHKSIIFSQFTTMLQLVEWRLRRAGITTVMLDGSMTPAQRQASIEHFMTNVETECFLVSLKAGGVALNLTEASRVFIVDPWWNPAAEWQSADRCHRIGQTRPCTITRLCIEDSVESRMVLLQEKKTSMINSTVNSDDKAMDSLSPQDLAFLFKGS